MAAGLTLEIIVGAVCRSPPFGFFARAAERPGSGLSAFMAITVAQGKLAVAPLKFVPPVLVELVASGTKSTSGLSAKDAIPE